MCDNKRKNLKEDEEMDAENNVDSEEDSDDGDSNPEAYTGNEEILVDFEGRNPIDSDFHGIRQLLHQLFLKSHINLSQLADLIIGQNYIGSVVIQSEVDDEEDLEDNDDIYDSNAIFGITTAINITHKKNITCLEQLKTFIIEKANGNATDEVKNKLKNILTNNDQHIGFLINERFINIPTQISVPLLENLCKEIERANNKKMQFNFTYYLMIVKFYRKEAKKNKPAEDIYTNQEEEVICKEAIFSFEYSVQSEADEGMSGQWLEDDSTLIPFRKVIVFDAVKLPQIVTSITGFITE